MPNSFLTPQTITREALRILHQKATFIGNINRQYDDSFAKTGAKIGSQLKIRLPNEYAVSSGATVSSWQDTTENSTTLEVSTQKHVPMYFGMADLTLTIDEFSKRYIEPAVSVLAANVEADAYSMYKDVYNMVDGDAAALAFSHVLAGRKVLNDNLTPMDSSRAAVLSTAHSAKLVDALKGLFNDPKEVSRQYREGEMGRTAGFNFYESTFASDHTTGTAAKTTGYLSNGATQSGATITVDTGTTTFKKGDVITFAGVYAVHPETKTSTGALKTFVITADAGASATSLAISPAVVATGPTQNVSNTIADNSAVVKVGAGASELLNTSMVFHKDAFTFATADLVLPNGVDFAARETMDGISMRIVRDYDITNDRILARLDILYGYKTIRPQMACRIHADG